MCVERTKRSLNAGPYRKASQVWAASKPIWQQATRDKADATSGVGAGALFGLLEANYGPGAVEAVKAAAASHPLVAKILMHGLEYAGAMKVAKVLHVFDGK
jgi:hypothetical protein